MFVRRRSTGVDDVRDTYSIAKVSEENKKTQLNINCITQMLSQNEIFIFNWSIIIDDLPAGFLSTVLHHRKRDVYQGNWHCSPPDSLAAGNICAEREIWRSGMFLPFPSTWRNRPTFSKVDQVQSTLVPDQNTGESLETLGTVGPLDIRMGHTCTTCEMSVRKRLGPFS